MTDEHDFVTEQDIEKARTFRKYREYRRKLAKGETLEVNTNTSNED